ncbi:MAG: hypothetical protein ACOVLE_06310, partial [Pirellula staleyi]
MRPGLKSGVSFQLAIRDSSQAGSLLHFGNRKGRTGLPLGFARCCGSHKLWNVGRRMELFKIVQGFDVIGKK